MMMPIIILAMSEPYLDDRGKILLERIRRFSWQLAYRSENHMQRHRYVEIECIIIAHANDKKHRHQHQIVSKGDA